MGSTKPSCPRPPKGNIIAACCAVLSGFIIEFGSTTEREYVDTIEAFLNEEGPSKNDALSAFDSLNSWVDTVDECIVSEKAVFDKALDVIYCAINA